MLSVLTVSVYMNHADAFSEKLITPNHCRLDDVARFRFIVDTFNDHRMYRIIETFFFFSATVYAATCTLHSMPSNTGAKSH